MNAVIHYCRACGFQKPAEAAAEAIHREFGIESELKTAFWGTFRVEYGVEHVYNRWRDEGFWGYMVFAEPPGPEKIVNLFRARLDPERARQEPPTKS